MERRSVPINVTSENWRKHAECKGASPGIFTELDIESHEKAKEYCETCPVPEPCVQEAIRNGLTGTYGGIIFRTGKKGRPNRPPGRQPKNPPPEV